MTKSERREQQRRKARYGMKVTGRSLLVVQQVIGKRAAGLTGGAASEGTMGRSKRSAGRTAVRVASGPPYASSFGECCPPANSAARHGGAK